MMPKAKPRDPNELNTSTIAKLHSNEEAAWALMEQLRWPDGPVCPHCGAAGTAYFLAPHSGERKTRTGKLSHRRLWKCADCRRPFSVLVGTIFENSKIPLSKWIMAVHHLCAGKNGMSAHELHRTLGVTYKTAWFMAHRIRFAMQQEPLRSKLSGLVDADETYIGGTIKGGPGHHREKAPVFSLVQRGGEVRSQLMQPVTSRNIDRALETQTERARTILFTDGLLLYQAPGNKMGWHETVEHGVGEYVRGTVHTNTVEGYFSQLKRSIDGTHHHVSERHLPRYLAEFDFRYNTRTDNDSDRTAKAVRQSAGKRLRYKAPTPINLLLRAPE